MIQKDFLQTFSVTDHATVNSIKEIFIPKLRKEIADLKSLEKECLTAGCGNCFAEDIQEAEDALRIALERLPR